MVAVTPVRITDNGARYRDNVTVFLMTVTFILRIYKGNLYLY